jgi:hypothetical protein
MHSRLAALVPGCLALTALLLCTPTSTQAGEAASSWGPGSTYLRLYGAYAPVQMERASIEESQAGYGAGLTFATGHRWGLSIDASHYEADDRGVTPILFGASYGAEHGRAFRPRVEFGLGYYGLERPSIPVLSGYPSTRYEPARRPDRGAVGGYLGLGADWAVSHRLGFSVEARSHNWRETGGGAFAAWDGFVSLGAGLTIVLSRAPVERWASR